MKLSYDDDLLETVVFACATKHWRGVPPRHLAQFHRARERLYDLPDPDERNAAFLRLHLECFRAWGMEQTLLNVAGEFPLFETKLDLLAFRKARGQNEEGAELYVQPETGRHAVVALRPERFEDEAALVCFMRHEFTHLRDMVSPAFGYGPELQTSHAAQQRLARERYRLLWDITIDGRLSGAGHPTLLAREQHYAAFVRAYAFWPAEKLERVFAGLWGNPEPLHADLVRWATDPRELGQAQTPLPGSPCPLCTFPTFKWADVDALPISLVVAVRAEFPAWELAQGLCSRCVEAYEAALNARAPFREPCEV